MQVLIIYEILIYVICLNLLYFHSNSVLFKVLSHVDEGAFEFPSLPDIDLNWDLFAGNALNIDGIFNDLPVTEMNGLILALVIPIFLTFLFLVGLRQTFLCHL